MVSETVRDVFLSTLPASREQRWVAFLVLAVLAAAFALVTPFARVPLRPPPGILPAAVLPASEAARLVAALITAGLLFALYVVDRSLAVLVLAAGYLFSALAVIAPYAAALTALFASRGSYLGRPQAWTGLFDVWFLIWHAIFAPAVLAYAALKTHRGRPTPPDRGPAVAILSCIVAVVMAIVVLAWLLTTGPVVARLTGHDGTVDLLWFYAMTGIFVLNILVFAVLWIRQRSLLDLCLIVVFGCLIFGAGLAVVVGRTQLTLGYYVDQVYELMAASIVLLVLVFEAMTLYAKHSQLSYRLLGIIEAIPAGIAIYDADNRLRQCNSHYRDLLPEIAKVDKAGVRLSDLVHRAKKRETDGTDSFEAGRLATNSIGSLGDETEAGEQQLPDGRWLQIREQRTADGSTVGIWTDISDVKRRETELRESKTQYEILNSHLMSLLETIPEGIAIFDADDRLVICNQPYRDLFPKVSEIIVPGLHFEELVRANLEHGSFKLSEAETENFFRERVALHRGPESLTELHLFDGRWIQVHKRRAANGSIIGVWADVTELRHRKEALRESKRITEMQSVLFHLARVSELAQIVSSLIHEVSQPIAAIRNYISGLQRLGVTGKLEDAPPILEKAGAQATRASDIVHRLREFVVRRETEKKSENLPRTIKDAVALALVGTSGQGIDVETRFDPKGSRAFVDRIQIEQVLFNLVRNAVEAMAGRPKREIVISTERLDKDRIEIRIADTGPGLSPAVRARLFQPFVTTKASGMGVGLSVCRAAVEAHGGELVAEDNPQGGTIFRFTVPAASVVGEEIGGSPDSAIETSSPGVLVSKP